MKAKKLISIPALLLCGAIFSACTAGNQKLTFVEYWKSDSLSSETVAEKLIYDVVAEDLASDSFVQYQNGVYTSELTSLAQNDAVIYTLKTKLTIDVVYNYGGESASFQDSVVTEAVFDRSLKPVSSHKEIVSHTPVNPSSNISKLSDCYNYFKTASDILYGDATASVTLTTETQNGDGTPDVTTKTPSVEFDDKKYTYLDNEQLLLALRGIDPSVTSSGKMLVYSPFVNAVQTIKFNYSSQAGGEFSFTKNGTELSEKTIQYYPVTLQIDAKNSGNAQTAWIAKTTKAGDNTYRNVMLRLESPIAYGIGTLVYTLKTAEF